MRMGGIGAFGGKQDETQDHLIGDDRAIRSADLRVCVFFVEAARNLFIAVLPDQTVLNGFNRPDQRRGALQPPFVKRPFQMGRDRFLGGRIEVQRGIGLGNPADRLTHRPLVGADMLTAAR